jgi:diguanylate cyclase (GGDEF)-like protein
MVLKEVAVRVRGAIRKSDTVGRLGGDEFLVLLAEVDSSAGALIAAEKIRRVIEQPMRFGHLTLNVAACVGVAVYPEHGSSMGELTRHSDAAMYFAKECGGDRAQLFSAQIMLGQFQKRSGESERIAC